MKKADIGAAPRADGVTLWRRIADDFEQAILAGSYRPGARLPGELELAGRLGVNRHTVRRALAELDQRGLVRAEQGIGTFVESNRLPYPIGARTRFSEIVGQAGQEVGGRLVAHAHEPASQVIAERLALAPDAAVIRLEVLRSANRVPLCAATIWVSAERMPGAEKIYRETRSMTRTLASFGIDEYRRCSTRVTARTADAVDAKRLRLAPGRPLLVTESVDVSSAGEVVSTALARFAADRVTLVVES